MLDSGAQFAGYRVLGTLGTGGMGAVYLVENVQLRRREALKVVSASGGHSTDFEERFLHEARAAAGLDHPGIVTIHHYGVEAGTPFFTMAFLDGQDLSKVVLNPDDVVTVVTAVADALDYAHSRGVIHRDIKPANVIVGRDDTGRLDKVVVVDFGIARVLDSAAVTTTGVFVGTLAYAAPEVLDGRAAGPRSDQYSLACATFEMLCGRAPFSAPTPAALMLAHITKPAPKSSESLGERFGAVDAVLGRALAKDPESRFPTVGDFARALADAIQTMSALSPETLRGEALSTTEQAPSADVDSGSTQSRRSRRAARVVAGVGAAVVLVAAVVASVILWPNPDGDSANAALPAASEVRPVTSETERPGGRCSPDTTRVTLGTDKPTYRSGQRMMFGWRVRNDGPVACPIDIGVSVTEVVVTSVDGKRQWGSRDCSPEKGTRVTVVQPNQVAPPVGYKWSMTTSELTCSQPRAALAPGRFRAVVTVDGIESEPATFTIE